MPVGQATTVNREIQEFDGRALLLRKCLGHLRPIPFHVEARRERISEDDVPLPVVVPTPRRKVVLIGCADVVSPKDTDRFDRAIGTDDHHPRRFGVQAIPKHRIEFDGRASPLDVVNPDRLRFDVSPDVQCGQNHFRHGVADQQRRHRDRKFFPEGPSTNWLFRYCHR